MSIILILLIIIALIFAPWIIYFKFTDDIESDTDENQKTAKIMMQRYCDKCGSELKIENTKFCDKCGAKLKEY